MLCFLASTLLLQTNVLPEANLVPHFVLFVCDLAVLNAPRHSEVLFSVSKCKTAVRCLLETVCVGETSSGLRCSAVGSEYSVNQSTIYSQ